MITMTPLLRIDIGGKSRKKENWDAIAVIYTECR
jgi:hypothetical protein